MTDITRREEGDGLPVSLGTLSFRLSDQALEVTVWNMRQAELLVTKVLERGIDYGRTPGTPADGLWDPGASKLINAFNSYPEYKILRKIEERELLSTTIEVRLVNRASGQVVGSGIGSASTRETKYKYRWVRDPENYGYTPEEVKSLKTRVSDAGVLSRITNPEYGELVNTIDKMAAKRADVDAAQSLPGVKSALRRLFDPQAPKAAPGPAKADWSGFWSRCRQMGLENTEVHQLLAVKSMQDWLDRGGTLESALEEIPRAITRAQQAGPGG